MIMIIIIFHDLRFDWLLTEELALPTVYLDSPPDSCPEDGIFWKFSESLRYIRMGT